MKEELALKFFEFRYFDKSFGIGFNSSLGTYFKNYDSRNKVTYLFICFNFICWQIAFQIPIKQYGIQRSGR